MHFEAFARLMDSQLENFHDEDIPEKFRKYVNPKAQDHGKEG